jgi:hypothetical protein
MVQKKMTGNIIIIFINIQKIKFIVVVLLVMRKLAIKASVAIKAATILLA